MLQAPTTNSEKLKALLQELQAIPFSTEMDKAAVLKSLSIKHGVQLNQRQFQILLKDNLATVEQILAQAKIEFTPAQAEKIKIAAQMTLVLAGVYFLPTSLFTFFATRKILEAILPKMFPDGEELEGVKTLFDLIGKVSLALELTNGGAIRCGYAGFLSKTNPITQYTPQKLIERGLVKGIEQYGSKAYLAAPTCVFLYHKGKSILNSCKEAASNFGSNCYAVSRKLTG